MTDKRISKFAIDFLYLFNLYDYHVCDGDCGFNCKEKREEIRKLLRKYFEAQNE